MKFLSPAGINGAVLKKADDLNQLASNAQELDTTM
jgi:hypothetical protein